MSAYPPLGVIFNPQALLDTMDQYQTEAMLYLDILDDLLETPIQANPARVTFLGTDQRWLALVSAKQHLDEALFNPANGSEDPQKRRNLPPLELILKATAALVRLTHRLYVCTRIKDFSSLDAVPSRRHQVRHRTRAHIP